MANNGRGEKKQIGWSSWNIARENDLKCNGWRTEIKALCASVRLENKFDKDRRIYFS